MPAAFLSFDWPWALLLLVSLGALVGAYVTMLRRRQPVAYVHSDVALLRAALPRRSMLRRHLPFGLLMVSLVSLVIATARPHRIANVDISRTSIVLALDISRSMCATDIAPNRLAVAQEAAIGFIETQPESAQIGIVTFSGATEIAVAPTDDKVVLTRAVEGLSTGFGTAMGSATLKAIDVIASVNPDVAPADVELTPPLATGDQVSPVPDIIVILTDGASSQGRDPLIAAEVAAARGVRLFTIGFGTDQPTEMVCSTEQTGVTVFADPRFDPTGGGGFVDPVAGSNNNNVRQLLVIDEPTLQAVAERTGGEYFRAQDAEQLKEVFASLPAQIEQEPARTEVTVAFVLIGATLAILALALGALFST